MSTDPIEFRIDATPLALAAMFVADEKEPNVAYRCVRVERRDAGGAYAVGLDGHSMAVTFDPDGVCPPEGLLLEVSPATIAACKKNKRVDKIAHLNAAGHLVITEHLLGITRHVQAEPAVNNHTFPDWHRILGKAAYAKPGLLPGVCLPVDDLTRFDLPGMQGMLFDRRDLYFYSISSSEPVFVRHGKAPNFLGIIMPLRPDAGIEAAHASPLPEWLSD